MHRAVSSPLAIAAYLVLSLALVFGGCQAGKTGLTTGPPDDEEEEDHRPEPCAAAPAAGSSVAELSWVSRTVREARANLMVRASAPARYAPLYATLHHPQLWLLEAILAEPRKARRADRRWLGENLLRTFVELRTARGDARIPLASSFKKALLVDDRGRRYRPLYLSRREDTRGAVYLLAFESSRWNEGQVPARLALSIPLPAPPLGPGGRLEARWALSVRALSHFDRQPIAVGLAPARLLRQARWSLLLGDLAEARRLAEEAARCPSDWQQAAEALVVALNSEAAAPLERLAKAAGGRAPEEPGRADAARTIGPVALRRGLLEWLEPLAVLGLIEHKQLAAARVALAGVASRQAKAPDPRRAAGSALVAFEAALVALLQAALVPGNALASHRNMPRARPRSRVVGSAARPAVNPRLLLAELARRVEQANAGLRPRYVGRADAPGRRCGARLCLVVEPGRPALLPQLVVRTGALTVFGTARERLGAGWVHPGLPGGLRFSVKRLDDSPAYWSAAVVQAVGPQGLARLARRLLRHEATTGDSPRAIALAVAGLVEVDGKRALSLVRGAIDRTPVARGAAALRGLHALREARSLATRWVAAGDAVRRAAALTVLGQQPGPPSASTRRALDAAEPEVARAALAALLRRGRAPAVVQRWLVGGKRWQREVALAELARVRRPLPRLALPLLAELKGPATPAEVIAALRAVLPARAAGPLLRLYKAAPKLRRAVLALALPRGAGASDRAWLKLWQLARQEGDVVLRRLALQGLARLARPPREALEQALADKDGVVRTAAHVGLARLGQSASLLALGGAARGSCAERALVLEPLCRAMDVTSRRKLLMDTLHSNCGASVLRLAWRMVVVHQPKDAALMRVGLGHPQRWLRVAAAATALGARGNAAQGVLVWD